MNVSRWANRRHEAREIQPRGKGCSGQSSLRIQILTACEWAVCYWGTVWRISLHADDPLLALLRKSYAAVADC
jgi:hypothetical protein